MRDFLRDYKKLIKQYQSILSLPIREREYERFKKYAQDKGFEAGSFENYCKILDEYDRAWEVANYEYDKSSY